MSETLNVSIDHLLDDENSLSMRTIREPVDLTKFSRKFSFTGRPGKTGRKDLLLRGKYPKAEIYALQAEQIETKAERIIDEMLFWTTDSPGGLTTLINRWKNTDLEYYLVNDGDQQFLILITEKFIETTRLADRITAQKFTYGNVRFKKCFRLPEQMK